MHNAPTVSYPVGRSHFQAGLSIFLVLTGLITVLSWAAQALWGWRGLILGASLGLAGVGAVWEWRRTLQGTLAWDGVAWCFSGGHQPVVGHVVVHLDFQMTMLLSLTPQPGQRLWLWAERRRQQPDWLALRRAVFARPKATLAQPSHAVTPPKFETS